MEPKLLDCVALTDDLPMKRLTRGQVGVTVEDLAPGVFLVEFSDDTGCTYGLEELSEQQFVVLRYEPSPAVA